MDATKPYLDIEQLEVVYAGFLQAPLLQVLTLESGVHALLFKKLAAFQPALQNSGFAASWHNLSEAYFELQLLGGYGLLRIWPNATEIRLQNTAPGLSGLSTEDLSRRVSELVTLTVTLLQSIGERVPFASHSITLNMHGRLQGLPVLDLLRSYVNPPPSELGALAELGARYAFGPADDRLASWLWVEPSASIRPDGIFVALGVTFKGETVEPPSLVERAQVYFQSLVRSADTPVKVRYASGASSF